MATIKGPGCTYVGIPTQYPFTLYGLFAAEHVLYQQLLKKYGGIHTSQFAYDMEPLISPNVFHEGGLPGPPYV